MVSIGDILIKLDEENIQYDFLYVINSSNNCNWHDNL